MWLNVIEFMTTVFYAFHRDKTETDKMQSSISHRNSLGSFEAQSSIMHKRKSMKWTRSLWSTFHILVPSFYWWGELIQMAHSMGYVEVPDPIPFPHTQSCATKGPVCLQICQPHGQALQWPSFVKLLASFKRGCVNIVHEVWLITFEL